jgi:hypothetical protein
MGAPRELIDAVIGGADDRLRDFGFTRRRYLRTIEVAPDVLGSVGLNRSDERGDNQLLINPVLGVRHQAVEREVARLCGERFDPYFPSTISAPLSQLAKRGGDYLFKGSREQKLDRQVKKMVDTIVAYALPFFKAHASLEAMASALRSGDYGFPHQVVYRLPVALALLGRHAEAQDTVRASLADLGDRHDRAAQDFRAFADAFAACPGPGTAY